MGIGRSEARLAAGLLLALAGCALVVRPDPAEPRGPAPGDEAPAVSIVPIDRARLPASLDTAYWARIRAGEPLRVGVNADYPPFTVRVAGAEPALAGLDVDLARHLAATLDVPVALVAIRSGEAADRLNDGTIDIAIAGLTRTASRAARVNFSAPYLTVSQAALVERRFTEPGGGTDEEQNLEPMSSYADLARVPGLRIGVADGTRPHRIALDRFPAARVTPFPTIEEASAALVAGRVAAVVHDDPYVRAWSRLHPTDAARFSALLEPVTDEPIAMAIRKGDLEFLRFLDVYVEEVRQDGTIARLYRRHFVDAAWAPGAAAGGAQ